MDKFYDQEDFKKWKLRRAKISKEVREEGESKHEKIEAEHVEHGKHEGEYTDDDHAGDSHSEEHHKIDMEHIWFHR
jgi:hypothetical protein